MEAELYQAAVDEHWPVDFTRRDEYFRKAQTALQHNAFGRALEEYARSLDLLTGGLQWQRKQKDPRVPKPPVTGNGSEPSPTAQSDREV
jgi:hypothetical protein